MPRRHDKSEPPAARAFGLVMLLIVAGFVVFAGQRNWLFIAAGAICGLTFYLAGSGRIYQPAVTMAGDVITCRFNPWRDAAFYVVLIGMPALAVTPIAEGSRSPSSLRIIGILWLLWTPVLLFRYVRQNRESLLRISPTALTVHQPGKHSAPTEVARGAIEAVTASTAQTLNYDSAPTVQIVYRDRGASSSGAHTVVFGPTNTKKTAWLTVEQADLLAGLQAWRDGDPTEPGLMDRVEAILRGPKSA